MKAFGADKIWKHSTGENVVVAVVGTGVDASEPDLKGQVLEGKDLTDEGGGAHKDLVGRGTAVAGIIASHGHGAGGDAGPKGLAPDAKILPVRVINERGDLGVSIDEGVRYAVDQGADVINLSVAFSTKDLRAQRAIEYAMRKDVIVVASAGSRGTRQENYPAAYPGVVSVGAVDETGGVWKDSSWGSNIALMGPGEQVVVIDDDFDAGYALSDGTAYATAFVSASAALVRSAHPDLTGGQVINRLTKTAKIPAGETSEPELPDPQYGYGIVRPYRAVTYDLPAGPEAGPLPQPSPSPTETGTVDTSGSDDSSTDWMYVLGPPIVLFGLIFVIIVVLVAILITVIMIRGRRKDKELQPAPGWPGPGGTGPTPMGPGPMQQPGPQVPQQQPWVPSQPPQAIPPAPPQPPAPPPGQFGPPLPPVPPRRQP